MSSFSILTSGFTYSPQNGGKRLEVFFSPTVLFYDRIVDDENGTDRIIDDETGTDRIIEVTYG